MNDMPQPNASMFINIMNNQLMIKMIWKDYSLY